jgi:hypothetical protein
LNYRRLHARIFCTFEEPPTEEEFYSYINEYQQNYLLFVYRCNGQLWGQWDTPDANLPRYKTAADNRSPEPPAEEFLKWKYAYSERKRSFAINFAGIQKFSEILQSAPETTNNFSQEFHHSAHGGGEGERGGGGVLSGVGAGPGVEKGVGPGERCGVGMHRDQEPPARPRKRY